jgi:hypothetical protein
MHLDYSAPPSCIDATTFRERLEALPASPGSTAAPDAVTIEIVERDETFHGNVVVRHADGTRTSRRVASARCSEVSDALEFVTALALGLDYAPPAAPAPAGPRPSESPTPVPVVAEPSHWRFSAGVRGVLISGAGPSFEPGPDVAFGAALDVPRWVAPSFELSGMWTTSGAFATTLNGGTGTTKISLAAAAATICPLRIHLAQSFALRPCAEGSFGALFGAGSGTNVTQTTTREPWVGLAPLARVEWQLGRRFRLEAESGPDFHVYRDQFYFQRTGSSAVSQAYQSPTVGSITRLGIAVLFP